MTCVLGAQLEEHQKRNPANEHWDFRSSFEELSRLAERKPPQPNPDYMSSAVPLPPTSTVLLGRTLLAEYAIDHANMTLPPWVRPAPIKAGSVTHGKLSADEWRTFCCVHLVVTLGRCWGGDPSAQQFKLLTNFMDLVFAIETAGTLALSDDDIKLYEFHMNRYLEGFKDLYKEANMVPNHHLALHVPNFLRFLGPGPNQRTFGMERFNYVLQKLKTNRNPGEERANSHICALR